MVKELTKQMLLDYGIKSVVQKEDGSWYIVRNWWAQGPKGNRAPEDKIINQTLAVCHHKYSGDIYYPKFTFCVNCKGVSISVSRLIYCWFVEDIPAGYDVDHIDNNSFNNNIDNLQILTRGENLAKRYEDSKMYCFNQYHNKINK